MILIGTVFKQNTKGGLYTSDYIFPSENKGTVYLCQLSQNHGYEHTVLQALTDIPYLIALSAAGNKHVDSVIVLQVRILILA